MKATFNTRVLELSLGDVTAQAVDAIVNAANSRLAGGGGVDGAIHRAGGPAIMEETRRRYPDGCPTGSAVISGGGKLAAKFVIHYPSYILFAAIAGRLELYFYPYVAVNALYAVKAFLGVSVRFGRSG